MSAFDTVSSRDFLVCPMCEAGRLGTFGGNSVRCNACGGLLAMAVSETLGEIVHLPDALGSHACECGHPEMRLLPGGIYRCPACGAEVLPVEETSPRCEAEAKRRKGAGPAGDGRSGPAEHRPGSGESLLRSRVVGWF